MGLNISCKFLWREKNQLVGTRLRRQGLTPEQRKARERKYSEGISELFHRESVEGMQVYGVLSQSLLSSMEVFPLTYADTEQGSTRMSLCLCRNIWSQNKNNYSTEWIALADFFSV